ncbi:MAG: hypothetical protein IJU66_02490 [Oscillospiraceae bacterium]|nr:hypothetical protein [Oscillospiraceae bacterium]
MKTIKRAASIVLCLLLAFGCFPSGMRAANTFSVWDGSYATAFAGGSGTQDDPFLIASASQLAYLERIVNSDSEGYGYSNSMRYVRTYFLLTCDIDLNGLNWTPIGFRDATFFGFFNGGGHTVKGLHVDVVNDKSLPPAGLFGTAYYGEIRALTLQDVDVKGQKNVGGLVGRLSSNVADCVVSGSVSGDYNVGGIAGYVNDIPGDGKYNLTGCVNTAAVRAVFDYCGGIAGIAGSADNTATLANCVNGGYVSGRDYVGGLTGFHGIISDSFNFGNVDGERLVGGITGYGFRTGNCGNIAAVSGEYFVGGINGYTTNGTIANCWNAGQVSGARDFKQICGRLENVTVQFCYGASEYGELLPPNTTVDTHNTISNLFTQPLASMPTAAFAATLNAGINPAVQTVWTQNAAVFGGYPCPATVLGTGGRTYTVNFSANGGSGRMNPASATRFVAFALPECEFTAPEGKRFRAWLVGDKEYQPGETVYLFTDGIISAIWSDAFSAAGQASRLRNCILENGAEIDDTVKYISLPVTGEDGVTQVMISSGTGDASFSFLCYAESGSMQTMTYLVYDAAACRAKDGTISVRISDGARQAEYAAPFDAAAYTTQTALAFAQTPQSVALPGYTAEQLGQMANAAVKAAVPYWNALCEKEASISLRDIGFEGYGTNQSAQIISLRRDKDKTTAQVLCVEAGASIACAAYDAEGRMLSVSTQAAQSGRNTYTFTHNAGADYIRVFVLKNFAPICTCKST